MFYKTLMQSRFSKKIRYPHNSEVASEESGRAVVNDSPADCQSRKVTEAEFSAENLARP